MPGKRIASRAFSNSIYRRAAKATGKTVPQLRAMAQSVFGSILLNVMDRRGSFVWTIAQLREDGQFSVEVDLPPRQRK